MLRAVHTALNCSGDHRGNRADDGGSFCASRRVAVHQNAQQQRRMIGRRAGTTISSRPSPTGPASRSLPRQSAQGASQEAIRRPTAAKEIQSPGRALASTYEVVAIAPRYTNAASSVSKPGDCAVVERAGTRRQLVMCCPDGCGEILSINLDPRSGPAWRLYKKHDAMFTARGRVFGFAPDAGRWPGEIELNAGSTKIAYRRSDGDPDPRRTGTPSQPTRPYPLDLPAEGRLPR